MSRGISIYYRLIKEDDTTLTFGYSGADIKKEYDKNMLLAYDGVIEILKDSLFHKDVLDAFKDNDIVIKTECIYETHHSRVIKGETTIGFFAMKVVFKVYSEFKERGTIEPIGAVVY